MPTCPKCGSQNNELAKFCQSCGAPLLQAQSPAPATVAPSPVPYYTFPTKTGIRTEEKVLIVAVVLVAILVVGGIAAAYIYFTPLVNRVSTRGPVTVTPLVLLILYPNGSFDTHFGSSPRTLSLFPIYLQHGEIHTSTFTLTLSSSDGDRTLESMTFGFSPGFSIQSVTPQLPYAMSRGSSVDVTVTWRAPNVDYTGPAALDLFTS
jgi:zinc-ribbon domain